MLIKLHSRKKIHFSSNLPKLFIGVGVNSMSRLGTWFYKPNFFQFEKKNICQKWFLQIFADETKRICPQQKNSKGEVLSNYIETLFRLVISLWLWVVSKTLSTYNILTVDQCVELALTQGYDAISYREDLLQCQGVFESDCVLQTVSADWQTYAFNCSDQSTLKTTTTLPSIDTTAVLITTSTTGIIQLCVSLD